VYVCVWSYACVFVCMCVFVCVYVCVGVYVQSTDTGTKPRVSEQDKWLVSVRLCMCVCVA